MICCVCDHILVEITDRFDINFPEPGLRCYDSFNVLSECVCRKRNQFCLEMSISDILK